MSVAQQQAMKLMEDGLDPAAVVRELEAQGVSAAEAHRVVSSLADYGEYQQGRFVEGEPKGGEGGTDLAVGALFLFGGLILTALTYASASPGGTYVLAWGPMLFGGVRLLRGFTRV